MDQLDLAEALREISEIEARMTSLSLGVERLENVDWSRCSRRLCDLTASLRRKIRYRLTDEPGLQSERRVY
nr:hypothetical protein [uncultured Lichenicoccus sp.]